MMISTKWFVFTEITLMKSCEILIKKAADVLLEVECYTQAIERYGIWKGTWYPFDLGAKWPQ